MVFSTGIVLTAAFLPGRLEAQTEPNPELGRLMGGALRVQLRARGVDSTQWFRGRILVTTAGCTHVQVLDGRWAGGQLRPDSTTVPANERISTPLRHLRRIQTSPLGAAPDTLAWTDVPLDTLLLGEASPCRPDP
jgi:hypothetical protein